MANSVIGALRVNLGLDSAQFQQGLKQAQSGMAKFGQTMKQGAMAAGAAFVAAGAGIGLAVRGILRNADELGKSAQSIGIPVDELSRLKHAADLSGASFSDLQTGVRRLSQSMQQFADGADNEATRAIQRLGIQLNDADGNLRATSDIMTDLAAAFGEMEDGAEKTAAAMAIFGRSGTNLIPMLNKGADALERMKQEADELGIVITPEMSENAERFHDNLTRLTAVLGGLATAIAADLAPMLADFTDWLVELARGFQEMDPWLREAIIRFGGFAAVVTPLVAVVAALAIPIVALGAPVALAAAGFLALGAAVAAFWPEIKAAATALVEFVSGAWAEFEGAWEGITAKVGEAKAVIRQFIDDILSWFRELPAQMLQIGIDMMQGLIDGIKSMGSAVVDSMMAPVRDGVSSVKSWLGIQSPSRLLHEIGVNTMQGFAQGMESMSGTIGSIADSIAGMVSGAFMSIVDGSKSVGEALKDLLRQVVSFMLNNAVRGLMGMLFGGGGGGFLGMLFGGFRANGGPVSSGRAYVVGERGPELMVPNSSGTVIPNHALQGKQQVEVSVTGVFVDDNGVIKARVDTMGRQAAAAGARIAGKQVSENMPGLVSNAQLRSL